MKLSEFVSKRKREGMLMLLSILYIILLSVAFVIGNSDVSFVSVLLPLMAAWGVVFLCHIVLKIFADEQTQNILPLVAVLIITGTVTILNVAPDLVTRHLISMCVGFVGFCGILLTYRLVDAEKLLNVLVITIFALLLATLILGSKRGGARSWIMLGSFGFQPSEIVKILLILVNAIFIVRFNRTFDKPDPVIRSKDLKKSKDAWLISSLWAATMFLLVFQNDFGMTLVFYVTCLMMALVATGNKKVLGAGLLFGCAAGVISITQISHITARFQAWINPWATPKGSGYQILQSLYTLANGGLVGKGFNGMNAKYLPASYTDMNFAVIGEELGFFGLCAIIIIIYLMVKKGMKAAENEENMISSLIKLGVSAFLGVQSWIIIAGNLRIVPLTGITIPFISFGGTSMVVSLTMIGMLFLSPKKVDKEEEILKRAGHMKKKIKMLNKIWAVACCILIAGCAYVQIYSYDNLINDVYNPRIIRSYQEATK